KQATAESSTRFPAPPLLAFAPPVGSASPLSTSSMDAFVNPAIVSPSSAHAHSFGSVLDPSDLQQSVSPHPSTAQFLSPASPTSLAELPYNGHSNSVKGKCS
ncbi:unnamed protein product, partial [Ilex paraguariensis]